MARNRETPACRTMNALEHSQSVLGMVRSDQGLVSFLLTMAFTVRINMKWRATTGQGLPDLCYMHCQCTAVMMVLTRFLDLPGIGPRSLVLNVANGNWPMGCCTSSDRCDGDDCKYEDSDQIGVLARFSGV